MRPTVTDTLSTIKKKFWVINNALHNASRCAPSLQLMTTLITSSPHVTWRTGSKVSCGIIWTRGLETAQHSTCWKYGRTRRGACSGIDLLENRVWTSLTGTLPVFFFMGPNKFFLVLWNPFQCTKFPFPCYHYDLWFVLGYGFFVYNDS